MNALTDSDRPSLPAGMSLEDMRHNAEEAVALLKSLANESRLMIMCVLAEGELSVGDLNQRIALSPSALSQHLAVLRHQGLVTTRREGQVIHYALADSQAIPLIERLHDIFCGEGSARGC